jgi:hypothetical protein
VKLQAWLQGDLASSSLSSGCKCLNGWSSSSSASCKRWMLRLLPKVHQEQEVTAAAAAVLSRLVVCYHMI